MYSLLTEPAVHKAHVAANQATKAQWLNLGMRNLTEDVQHYKTPSFSFQSLQMLNVSFDYNKDVEVFDNSRKLTLL